MHASLCNLHEIIQEFLEYITMKILSCQTVYLLVYVLLLSSAMFAHVSPSLSSNLLPLLEFAFDHTNLYVELNTFALLRRK